MDKKQVEMKQQIASMMRKKDYYDILGVQKATATEAQIKKSYKKLALRFHPDKNSTQGSKQVFKKVSNAYSVLINQEQKQRYDRFGPEQQQPVRHRPQRHAYHGQGDDQFDQFNDIFKAFFGMNGMQMRGQGFRTYTYNMGGTGPQRNGAQPRNQGLNLGYFFIIIFLFYAIAPLFKSSPYFSLSPNSEYKFKINSDFLNTQYFVREGYFDEIKKNSAFKKQVDFEADGMHYSNLKKTCEKATRLKGQYEYQAYQYRPGQYRDYYMQQASKVDLSSCRKIKQLYQNYPEYVSNLNYYR